MKLQFELDINAGRAAVWAAFDNPDNMQRWQPALKSFAPKSGTPGQPGAVSELIYVEKGRELLLTRTITERREPDFLAAVYESSQGKTLTVSHFEVVDDDTTRCKVWSNLSFKGMMNPMSIFLAASIRKRNAADLQRLKLMVETDQANATP